MSAKNSLHDQIKLNYTELEPCVRKIEVTIPAPAVAGAIDETLKEIADVAQVSGFRKGKAPLPVVKSRFRGVIEEELLKRLYTHGYDKILEDHKEDLVSYVVSPDNPKQVKMDQDFNFSITINVAPEFTLPEYKGVQIEAEPVAISEDDINLRLTHYRNAYSTYQPVAGPTQTGDLLKISYHSDFNVPANASPQLANQLNSKENWVSLTGPEPIPGIAKALGQAEVGKEYPCRTVYPDTFEIAELRQQTVNYQIQVLEIQRQTPPESDEALATKMKVESVDELRGQVRAELESIGRANQQARLRQEVVNKISGPIPEFPLPPAIVEEETISELRAMAEELVKTQNDADQFKEKRDEYRRQAEQKAKAKVREFFILRKIARLEKIQVEPEEVNNQLKGLSYRFGCKERELRERMTEDGGINALEAELLTRKVAKFLVAHAAIKGQEASPTKPSKEQE